MRVVLGTIKQIKPSLKDYSTYKKGGEVNLYQGFFGRIEGINYSEEQNRREIFVATIEEAIHCLQSNDGLAIRFKLEQQPRELIVTIAQLLNFPQETINYYKSLVE